MAAIICNVDCNYDTPSVAPGTTGTDTYSINGATLTIDTDTRWCSNHAGASGNLGSTSTAVTISSAIGGTLKIDGSNIKMIPFTGASGTLPSVSTFIAPTAMTWSAGITTVTFGNTYAVGDIVVIANAYPAAWNGTFTVLTASGSQITYAQSVDPTPIQNIGGTPAPNCTKMWKVSQAFAKTNTSITRTASGANWLVSVVAPKHNFVTGNSVVVSGVTPAMYNGTWVITRLDNDNFTFTIIGGADPGAVTVLGTSTKTVTAHLLNAWGLNNGAVPTAITTTGTTTTVSVTTTPQVGDVVTFSGVTPAAYNGTYTVATVSANTSFTYTRTDTPASATAFGTFTMPERTLTTASGVGPNTVLTPTGWLKVKNVVNGPFEYGALTIQGGTTPVATATGPEMVAPMEVVGCDGGKIVVPRLGKLVMAGAWFNLRSAPLATMSIVPSGSAGAWTATITTTSYFGNATAQPHGLLVGQEITISGAASGLYNGVWRIASVPSTTTFTIALTTTSTLVTATVQGSIVPTVCTTGVNTKQYLLPISAASAPGGVWVETDVGTEVYEFYPSAFTYATASGIATDSARGKVCFITTAGVLRFGHDGTQANGYTPKAGLKIRFPNIITAGAAAANAAANTISVSGTRFGLTTTSAGYISIDKSHVYFAPTCVQPFYVGLTNSIFDSQISQSEIASSIDWDNIHVGPNSTTAVAPLILATCFAGGTISNSTFTTYTTATAGCGNIQNMSGFTFNNCDFRSITPDATAPSTTVANSLLTLNLSNFTFNNNRFIGAGRVFLQTCSNINFNNTKYAHSGGNTAYSATPADYVFDVQTNSNYITINGLDWLTSPIYSISCTSNVVTAKTSTPHGLASSQFVDIRNLSNSIYNANYVLITVVDTVTFTYQTVAPDITTTIQSAGTFNYSNMQNPVNGLLNIVASNYVKMRNVGSYQSRLFLGQMSGTTSTAYIAATGTSVGIGNELKRIYVQNTKTAPLLQLNSYSGFVCENVFADRDDGLSLFNLNSIYKGCSWASLPSDNTTTYASVYGTHFLDTFYPVNKQFFIPCVTANTTTVTSSALFGEVTVGMRVIGFGVPDGCTVSAIASTSSITISAATNIAGNVRLMFTLPGQNEKMTHTMYCSTTSGSNILTSNQSISVTTTTGLKQITTTANAFAYVEEDASIVGTGIPIGAKVMVKIDANTIIMNLPATATGTITASFPGFAVITSTQAISSTTTSGSCTITSASLFGTVLAGMEISGTGIPAGTFVTGVTTTSALTISQPATATGTATLTYNGLTVGDVQVGMMVSGVGVPYGTHITKLLDSNSALMSDNATLTNSATILSFIHNASQINVMCNEPTSTTIGQVTLGGTNSAQAGFNSLGSLVLPIKNDQCTWVTPHKIIGHLGFAHEVPSVLSATQAANITSTNTAVTVTSLTTGTNTIASAAAFLTTWLGMPVYGVGIPPDSYITSIASTSSLTINNLIQTAGATTITVGNSAWNSGETTMPLIGHRLQVGDTLQIPLTSGTASGLCSHRVIHQPQRYSARAIYKQSFFPGSHLAAGTSSVKIPAIWMSTSATWATGQTTITTSAVHGLVVGDFVTIVDAVATNPRNLNGTWQITSVPTTTTFKINNIETFGTHTANTGTIRPLTNIDLFYDLDNGGGFTSLKPLRLNKKECYIQCRSLVCSTTTSVTVTSSSLFSGVKVGDYVFGPGVPQNTWIQSITSTSSITLNQATTTTVTGVSLHFVPTTNAIVTMGQSIACQTTSASNTVTSTQAIATTSTTGSQVVTSTALFGNITPGMSITGTGVTAGTYVVSVESTSSLTVNQAIGTGGANTYTFTGFGAVSVGMYVSGTGIITGTTVTAIASNSSLTLSNTASATGTSSLIFSWDQTPTSNMIIGDNMFGQIVDLGSSIVSVDSSFQVTLNKPPLMTTPYGFSTIYVGRISEEVVTDPSIGFYLKVNAKANSNGYSNILSNIGIQTLSDNTTQAYQYVLDPATMTFTNLVPGSEVRVYAGTDPATAVEIGGVESSGTSFSFTHGYAGQVGFIVVHALGKQAIRYDNYTFNATDNILVQQQLDRQYYNPM